MSGNYLDNNTLRRGDVYQYTESAFSLKYCHMKPSVCMSIQFEPLAIFPQSPCSGGSISLETTLDDAVIIYHHDTPPGTVNKWILKICQDHQYITKMAEIVII